jgi:hypothetical protein
MRHDRTVPIVALAVLLATACAAPPAPPLEPSDFAPSGVPSDADSAELRLSLGEPASVSTDDNPFDPDVPLITWHYPGMEIRFGDGAVPVGFLLEDSTEATVRGLRVGHPASFAVTLYGRPTYRVPPSWTWVDQSDPESYLQIVDVMIEGDVVSRIYLGRALR